VAIVSVRAVSYEVMADYLAGNPLNPCALAGAAHDRVWIIGVTNSDASPLNAFEGWAGGGPVALVADGERRLALSFDDIEARDDRPRDPRFVYFDEAMAARVCDFIRRAHGDDATRRDLLLVHCHAGVSRSGAIADFARAVTAVDYDTFRRANPQVVPNVTVRRLLLTAWEGPRGDGENSAQPA
jgi:hypothetical protein